MKLKMYTEKKVNESTCYLCGCTLQEYIENVPEQYMDNTIQRGIVHNIYLDKLIDTITKNENIPTITLVANQIKLESEFIEISNFKILDGLQRTYRIKSIWNALEFFEAISDKDKLISMNRISLTREFKKEIQEKALDFDVFQAVINEYKKNRTTTKIKDYYIENIQWFEVWYNLSEDQEIEKMLILNAGHRPMEIRHQLELLFLNRLPELNSVCVEKGGKEIIRSKDKSDTIYSKERKVGEYYFSHLISAILSFEKGEAVTTNAGLINKLQQYDKEDLYDINYILIQKTIEFLLCFDEILSKQYGQDGVKWLSRETVLVGIFAALGDYNKTTHERDEDYIKTTHERDVFEIFLGKIRNNNNILCLENYERAKQDNMEISKVNIGSATKKAVKEAVTSILFDKGPVDWHKCFGGK